MSVSNTAANSTARSELEVLRRRNAELEAELETIDGLSSENFDLKREVAKLREYNEDFKSRLAKMEQDSSVDEQDSLVVDEQLEESVIVVPPSPSGISASTNSDTLTTEDKEMYAFVVEQHKKSISEEIRQRNRETPSVSQNTASDSAVNVSLECDSAPNNANTEATGERKIQQETASCDIKPVNIVNDQESTSRDIKTVNNVNDQESTSRDIKTVNNVNDQESEFTEDKSIVTEFVQGLLQELLSSGSQVPESIKFSTSTALSTSISLKKLANLFYQANNAKKNTIKAKRTEISSWCCYSKRFEDKVMELRSGDKNLRDKTARGQIYNEIKPFLTGVSDGYLRVMTCKARKINKLFGYEYDPVSLEKNNGIGWRMIHRVTCSADSISRLTNPQIKYIVDQVKSKTVNNVNDQSHVTENFPPTVPQESFANVDESDIDFGLDDEILDDDESDIDFGLDDEILDDKSGDNVFDDIDFDDEILDGIPTLPVDLNHPINARTEGVSVQA
ncbi:unnamed protein product [Rhizophagus irregularis]|nr:unnamed protein product [Rhizophagus irregularis]